MNKPENNGGKTGYYDLPLPDREKIRSYLIAFKQNSMSLDFALDKILEQCPQTLNDIIEYKSMKPWQHEVMKACYAIDERALKNGGSYEREINKIIYYANRGLVQILEREARSKLAPAPHVHQAPPIPKPVQPIARAVDKVPAAQIKKPIKGATIFVGSKGALFHNDNTIPYELLSKILWGKQGIAPINFTTPDHVNGYLLEGEVVAVQEGMKFYE